MRNEMSNDRAHHPSPHASAAHQRVRHAKLTGLLLVVIAVSGYGGYRISQATLDGAVDVDALRSAALTQLLSERALHAAAATSDESFAVATGPIDSDVEGLYILDSITGDLHCTVLNFRTGKFNAVFRTNVKADLGGDAAKRPQYLMTTGIINFPRGASAARPGNSVVYVLDTTTGNFAAYGIPWRRELAATGRPQAAGLTLLDIGQSRTTALRE